MNTSEKKQNEKGTSHFSWIFFLLVQPIFLAVLYFVGLTMQSSDNQYLLLILGIWNIAIYIRLLQKEFTQVAFPSFLVFYLLISLLRGGLAQIYLYLSALYDIDSVFIFFLMDLRDDIWQGALLVSCEEYFIIAGYMLMRHWLSGATSCKGTISNFKSFSCVGIATHKYLYYGLFCYFIYWAFNIAAFAGFNLGKLGIFFAFYTRSGFVIALIFLMLSVASKAVNAKNSLIVLILITLFQAIFAMRFEMKEGVIVPFIPLILLMVFRIVEKKTYLFSLKHLLGVLVLTYILVMVVFPYAPIVRKTNNWSYEYLFDELMKVNTPGAYEFKRALALDGPGYGMLLRRNSWAREATWSIIFVRENGYYGMNIMHAALIALVPRFLWPEKPLIRYGVMLDAIIRNINESDSTSSTGLGLGGITYFSAGFFFTFIVVLLNGFCLGLVEYGVSRSLLYNPISIIVYYNTMLQALRHFESFTDFGISFFGQMFFLLLLAKILDKFFANILYTNNNEHIAMKSVPA